MAVYGCQDRDQPSRVPRFGKVGLLAPVRTVSLRGIRAPSSQYHLHTPFTRFDFFEHLTAWCRAVFFCRVRYARSRSREVGLTREHARGIRPPLSQCHLHPPMVRSKFFHSWLPGAGLCSPAGLATRDHGRSCRARSLWCSNARTAFGHYWVNAFYTRRWPMGIFFKVFTVWRKAVQVCGFRDARSWPARSPEVGLLCERERGIRLQLS